MYSGKAATLLDLYSTAIGDQVEVTVAREGPKGEPGSGHLVLRGAVMGPFGPSTDSSIVLKLESGYNFSMDVDRVRSMKVMGRAETARVQRARSGEGPPSLPPVTLIGTGGTIASYVDQRTGAVCPVSSPDDLLYLLPGLGNVCRLSVSLPLSKLSEDMTPDDWMVMAREVVQAFGAGARGVVIAHGTDTLALSAAALSFVLRDLPGPVVLTGSQRSSDRPSSDSFSNLFHALELAARSDLGEVCVLMHANISDGISAVHRGTRVRKMHTSRRDAFRSINSEVLGTVSEKGIQLEGPYRRADPSSVPYIDGAFSKEVLLLNAQVTLDANLLEEIGRSKRALVIAGTGLGHVSSSLVPVLKGLVSGGRPVVMASSCINGRVNMKVYSTGRDLLEAGVLEAGDMTPETALVKTMWCMGKIGPEGAIVERFRDLFSSDVAGEVDPRSVHSAFTEPSATEGRGARTN